MATKQETQSPIFFFGHQHRPDNSHVFSQFYPCQFVDEEGYQYRCAEQYMMAQKAVVFLHAHSKNHDILDKIMKTTDPKAIKALGRQIGGFDEQTWKKVRQDVVYSGNYYKFSQNPELKKILLDTGDRELFEASPYDTIWGIGVDKETATSVPRTRWGQKYWKGSNLLGQALMWVRDDLKQEQKKN